MRRSRGVEGATLGGRVELACLLRARLPDDLRAVTTRLTPEQKDSVTKGRTHRQKHVQHQGQGRVGSTPLRQRIILMA